MYDLLIVCLGIINVVFLLLIVISSNSTVRQLIDLNKQIVEMNKPKPKSVVDVLCEKDNIDCRYCDANRKKGNIKCVMCGNVFK